MKKTRRLFFILLILPVLLLTCSLPPYNRDVSLALLSIGKMDIDATLGPLDVEWWEYEDADFFFVPLKQNVNRGYIVKANDYSIEIRFIVHDGKDHYGIEGHREGEFKGRSETRLGYRAETVKGDDLLGLLMFDPESLGSNKYFLFKYQPPGDIQDVAQETLEEHLGVDRVLSAHNYPQPDSGYDRVYFLCKLESGNYSEYYCDTDSLNGLGAPTPVRTDFPLAGLPADLENPFYYHHPDSVPGSETSYICFYSKEEGSYISYSWKPSDTNPVLTLLEGMDRRIDAVLSTGELFSRSENMGYIYDGAGKKLYSFPMGDLRFVYEVYRDGEYRIVFTIPFWAGRYLYLGVYSIPTLSLSDLD